MSSLRERVTALLLLARPARSPLQPRLPPAAVGLANMRSGLALARAANALRAPSAPDRAVAERFSNQASM
jgi:hypothetical protein